VDLEALETGNHSGIFIGRVFPVEAAAQRPSEITVGKGEDLVLVYRDAENTIPGIPWERRSVIEPVVDVVPRLHVYDVASLPLAEALLKAATNVPGTRLREEYIPVTRSLAITRRLAEKVDGENDPSGMYGIPLVLDLIYPTIVLSPESTAELYLQTSSARQRHGLAPEAPFDPQVPGTVRLRRIPGGIGVIPPPPGYRQVLVRGNPRAAAPLDEGLFTFMAPIALGPVPPRSYATDEDVAALESGDNGGSSQPMSDGILSVITVSADGGLVGGQRRVTLPVLQVRGGDDVYAGFRWTGADGVEQWTVSRIPLRRDVSFDVLDHRCLQPLESLFVGESFSMRVMDPVLDTSEGKDTVQVEVKAESGVTQSVPLVETLETSGIFKGALKLVFAGDPNRTEQEGVLPVQYGDVLTLRYRPAGATGDIQRTVTVFRGADGKVQPFTKRFADPEIAVQTQFTIAEAYFEQAKKYRELKQEDLARDVIAQGRRLLDEAIREYPATEARAQAEYLLAELALEYANDATGDKDKQQRFYMEAIGRFSDIVALYPDSAYAPKAQYKKALTFEKMGQIDEASGEYVKLSYRYPDNELVAETIARLGQYFLTKGREMQEQADAETDLVKAETIRRKAIDMYRTSAEVFGRLAERFPNHNLAGRTLVLSAQSYMRALEWRRAIQVFDKIITARTAEPDLIAQSMYWAADCYIKDKSPDLVAAYRLFKRLTWDYPESQWAKYARGRLTEDQMVTIEENEGKAK
jgi:outer membrane protein assembly factor BamD (BamD/ComL family)